MTIKKLKLFKSAAVLLTLLAVLLTAQVASAQLVVTNVFYSWDPSQNKLQNSLIVADWDSSYIPLLHQFTFNTTLYDTSTHAGAGATVCGSTRYAGVIQMGLHNTRSDGTTAFLDSRDWKIVDCDLNGDGSFNNADLSVNPFMNYNELTDLEIIVISEDVPTAGSSANGCTGQCAQTLITTLYVNTDLDCNGVQDVAASRTSPFYCYYAEAQLTDEATGNAWSSGNAQARVAAGGGSKTVNFRPDFTPTAISLTEFTAGGAQSLAWAFGAALLGVSILIVLAGRMVLRRQDQ